jgi:tRNA modification GTPase
MQNPNLASHCEEERRSNPDPQNQHSSTIVAIATPPGTSGIGIVRISGPTALLISQKMFAPSLRGVQSTTKQSQTDPQITPRTATLGTVFGTDFTDTALAIYFQNPHSFTGEDIIEFQCHGGWLLLNKVVQTAISYGATPAQRGEFARRAFLNGKLSLDQAESIIEIINAESDTHLKYASAVYNGALREKLQSFERNLIEITAQIEATLDYPEHDIEHSTLEQITPQIKTLLAEITDLVNTAQTTGRFIANGINVAVLGRPNVGKSSIFNALLGTDRSIVTEIPGTTTDTISDAIIYNGVKINFHDTAGLRDASGKIEKLGIGRTTRTLNDCDIALVIFDATDIEVPELLEMVKTKPHLVIYNKCDLVKPKGVFSASAKTGENIPAIKQKIYDLAITTQPKTDQIVVTNARHTKLLTLTQTALENALAQNIPLDCIATEVQSALAHIGNITGTHVSQAVLDEIFSKFCLGK